jgi:hypothetical protein
LINYRSTGSTASLTSAELSKSSYAQSVFKKVNVMTLPGLSGNGYFANNLAAYVDFNWIGRYGSNPATLLKKRISSPVAVLINESDCPNFQCINNLDKHTIYKDHGIALVQVSNNSNGLSNLSPNLWETWAYTKFVKLH